MTHYRFLVGVVAVAGFLAATVPASAVILYGYDNSGNTTAPANGAPWEYVAQLDADNASGVYLGNGYILTANHVLPIPTTAFLNGTLYTVDSSYAPLQLDGADLKLIRILGDPGLDPLPLASGLDSDRSQVSTIIGWGVGKGAELPDQGWYWGDNSTRMERWGTNTTLPLYISDGTHIYLQTTFDRTGGSSEAGLSIGDSGGGLFQYIDHEWKLAGLNNGAEQLVAGPATTVYDGDLSTPGDQAAHDYFLEIKPFASTLNTIVATAVPEPSSVYLFAATGALLMSMIRRRRELPQKS